MTCVPRHLESAGVGAVGMEHVCPNDHEKYGHTILVKKVRLLGGALKSRTPTLGFSEMLRDLC